MRTHSTRRPRIVSTNHDASQRVLLRVLSVVTLVRNRNDMLRNLCLSLAAQTSDDFDLTIVRAGGDEDPRDVADDFGFTVVTCHGGRTHDDRIDYSGARNYGARRASGHLLLFVDADTMLGPRSVESMNGALATVDALCTGELTYLPPNHDRLGDTTFERLAETARPHPARPSTPSSGFRLGSDHAMVWGLNMGLRRAAFEAAGGFDEGYHGYAGEDTDFARRLKALRFSTAFVAGVEILHQHHDSFEPPLHQFSATVSNAQRYYDSWGEWPMVGWLDRFEELGLITRSNGFAITVRQPSPDEIEAARCTRAAPFRE